MKKVLIFFLLIFATLISTAQNKTGFIKTGSTVLDKPMTFSATADLDSTSGTYYITVTSDQLYPTKQNMYATLAKVSGTPTVGITLYGKCFTGDSWTQIGDTVTWLTVTKNPVHISAATPNQYRYYKAAFVCTSSSQKVKITAFDFKVWYTSGLYSSGTLTDGTATINSGALSGATTGSFSGAVTTAALSASGRITGTLGATVSGATSNVNASSNYATNINTGSSSGAVSIGGGSGTVAINSKGGANFVPLIIGTKSNTAGSGLALVGVTDNTGGIQIFCDDGGVSVASVTSPIWTRYMMTAAQTDGGTQTGLYAQLKTKDAGTTFTGGSITALKAYNQAGIVTLASAASYGIINAGTTLAGTMTVPTGTTFSGIDINLGGVGPVTVTGTGTSAGLIIRNKGEGATWPHDIILQNGALIDNTTSGSLTIPNLIRKHTPAVFNSTGTLSAANMLAGVVQCTSTSAVTMTTPTATAIAALIPGCAEGTAFDLIIDNYNSSSSGAVTLALDNSITVVNPAIITGGATLTLAVATTAKFSFYFTSATTAKCYRVY
jgi:hypothetical protein